ncbi:MAG: Ig-like domain-containing protein, partial [Burkholderiaceae bacterium]|nr:Ig-like domain-containing protein [Burkholderiaceae bacterium]
MTTINPNDFPGRGFPLTAAEKSGEAQVIVHLERGQSVVGGVGTTEIFIVHARREEVINFAREGSQLVIELADGSRIKIQNFFTGNDQLIFLEGDQPYWVDFSNALGRGGDGIDDALLQWFVPVEHLAEDDSNTALLALLGLLGVGGIAYATRGGNDDVDLTNYQPRTPPDYVDHTGLIQSDHSTAKTTDESKPGINVGSLPSEAVEVRLYDNGKLIPSTYDPETGRLTPNSPLDEGSHSFTYTVVDKNGHESKKSSPIEIAVDTSVPDTPQDAPPGYIDNVGPVTSGNSHASSTDDNQPGILIDKDKVNDKSQPVLIVDGKEVPANYDPDTGALTPKEPLGEGDHDISYKLRNPDTGAEGGESPPIHITVDTSVPDTPQDAPPGYIDIVGPITSNDSHAPSTDDKQPGIL